MVIITSGSPENFSQNPTSPDESAGTKPQGREGFPRGVPLRRGLPSRQYIIGVLAANRHQGGQVVAHAPHYLSIKHADRLRAMALPYVMAMDSVDYYDGHERTWLLGKPVGGS